MSAPEFRIYYVKMTYTIGEDSSVGTLTSVVKERSLLHATDRARNCIADRHASFRITGCEAQEYFHKDEPGILEISP